MAGKRRSRKSPGLLFVRVVLPLGLLVVAIAMAIVGPRDAAPGVALAALFVFVADWLIRLGISSQDDRDSEQERRRSFRRTGRWPEDQPHPRRPRSRPDR